MAKFHRYSLGNAMLIAWQRPKATHVAGFHTWKKLGRRVKRGEKGIRILAPILRKRPVGDGAESGSTMNEQVDENEDGETITFKSVCVFDVAQTSGKPLPAFSEVEGEPGQFAERLREFIAAKGIDLEYSDRTGTAEGFSAGGRIVLRKGLPAAAELSVLVHELAHELLHQGEEAKPESKTVRETEAEAVAFSVCQAVGLEARDSSADYIQLYRGSKDTLMESLARNRDVAVEIIRAVVDVREAGERSAGTPQQAERARVSGGLQWASSVAQVNASAG
ncbi:MAG: hypothetical protein JW820_16530 [Spirochaetales bacterium]|nr:hypothetical protein [Spirochaetales bacterium]